MTTNTLNVRNMIWGVAPKGQSGVYIEMHNVREDTVSFQTLHAQEVELLIGALRAAVDESKNGVHERDTPITFTMQQRDGKRAVRVDDDGNVMEEVWNGKAWVPSGQRERLD